MKHYLPKHPQQQRNTDSQMSRGYYLMAAVCCTILVAGFFFAARQHFSSMDYGIKNSRLRKQIDELEAEKRRLLVAKEISLTPAELRKAAKRIGIYDNTSVQAEFIGSAMRIVKTAEAVLTIHKPAGNKVVPTVMTAPVKPDKSERQARLDVAKDKKNRT